MRSRWPGINHRTAPLALREKINVPSDKTDEVTGKISQDLPIKEIVVLSTCNRTEFYWASEEHVDPIQFFKAIPGVDSATLEELSPSIYSRQGKEVARHLFEVACGLDSLVLGETQVYNQVKNAYEFSRAHGFTGSALNFLFQKAFETTKKVHSQTGLSSQRASIPSVAMEFARAIFENIQDCYVLVIGTGETAQVTLEVLRKRGAHKIGFVTRTAERACDWQCSHEQADVTVLVEN